MTQWSRDVTPENVHAEYPRPQMVRRQWLNLNGLWDYSLTDKNAEQPGAFKEQILVPFPIESALSGVMRKLDPKERLWYHRRFTVPKEWAGQRVLLHFGAVDWEATVYVNGRELGSHRGGFDAFTFDITRALKSDGFQDLVVAVHDPTDTSWQLRGKQTLRPGGASYSACSGIWQTVWLEPVPHSAIEQLKMVADLAPSSLHLTICCRTLPEPLTVTATAFEDKTVVATGTCTLNTEMTLAVKKNLTWYKATSTWGSVMVDLPIKKAKLWTPDSPFLYGLTVELLGKDGKPLDTVQSYFGMRTIAVGHDAKGIARPFLNDKPIMLPGALDQGYWPDGIFTAPTDEALRFDVEAAKKLGLVAVRKHIKVEPDRSYYWADKLGLLVFQDMPSGKGGDSFTDQPTSPQAAMQCEAEMRTLIQQRWNHPSIICWVLFNEGWGQYDTLRHARWAKQLDPTRLIDEASGFPWHGGGDVVDTHGGNAPKDPRRISIDTETAGFGLAAPGHSWPGKPWATGTYDPKTGGEGQGDLYPIDEESKRWYTRQIQRLYRAMWRNRDETGSSGDFKVQLHDVEEECNGFLSYDRALWKVDPEAIARACRGEQLQASMIDLLPCAFTKQIRWRYTNAKPADGWFDTKFDDSSWQEGYAGFGIAMPGAKVGTPWKTSDIWLRTEFDLVARPIGPLLRIFHDEDVEVYLNGELACRDGGFLSAYEDFEIDSRAAATLKPGKNVIAVHCHQTTGGQYIDVGLVSGKNDSKQTNSGTGSKLTATGKEVVFTYSNPIYFQGKTYKDEVRDPCIIKEGDTYYLVFTVWPFRNREVRHLQDEDQGSSPGIKLYSSVDLHDWKFEKWLVKSSELPENCPYKHRFWAPEIHRIGGKFYLIFTADNWLKKENNPAGSWGTAGYAFVGVADKITGPYEHISYIPGGACDMTLMEDDDGKVYAFIPRYDIDIQEIDLSGIGQGNVKLLGKAKKIITVDNPESRQDTRPDYLEGPWARKINHKYFLFYAGPYTDKKTGKDNGYWTHVAYADSPQGPWRKDARSKLFLGGHLSVFEGPDGRNWFCYRGEKLPQTRGFLCIDPFDIDNLHQRVQCTGPTIGEQFLRFQKKGK